MVLGTVKLDHVKQSPIAIGPGNLQLRIRRIYI